jgi:hypothetical protein
MIFRFNFLLTNFHRFFSMRYIITVGCCDSPRITVHLGQYVCTNCGTCFPDSLVVDIPTIERDKPSSTRQNSTLLTDHNPNRILPPPYPHNNQEADRRNSRRIRVRRSETSTE